MSIPEAVTALLERVPEAAEAITPIDQTADTESDTPLRVTTVLLEQEGGKRWLAALPADCLLDIERLKQQLGSPLHALTPAQHQQLLEPLGLANLPPLPSLLRLPLLLDERLQQADCLLLESGTADTWLRVPAAAFQALLTDQTVQTLAFSHPLQQVRPNLNEPEKDLAEISQARQQLTTDRIRSRLEESVEIPPLPASAQQIIQLRMNPDAPTDELVRIIESDPSLATQVIRWASSAYYGAPGRVKSIQDAVVRVLGFDLVLNLSLGLTVGKTLQLPRDGVHGYTPYWHDAVYCAATVERLVRQLPARHRPHLGLAYLSGLVHNFGYLILAHIFPPHFSLYCRYQEANPNIAPLYIEHYLFGITREQANGFLMQQWGLPEEVVTAVRQQHNPAYQGGYHRYANLLYLARQLIQGVPASRLPAELYTRLQLTPEQAERALEQIQETTQELDSMAERLTTANRR